VDSNAAAVDDRDRKAILVHRVEVGLDRVLGHLGGFLDRLTLGGDAGQLGHEDTEAAFGLRLQDDLVLALDAHDSARGYEPLTLLGFNSKPE
jgi:hypothetical protein